MAAQKTKAELRDETKLMLELAELWHERGLSLPTRTIFVGSEATSEDEGESGVDNRLAERVLKNIHVLERLSGEPITLLINNPGGDIYHGLALVDAIQQTECAIVGVVRGHAMSMASWILQACDRRIMGPLATQLIHYGTAGYIGHPKTFQKWAAEDNRLNSLMEQTYLKRIREKYPTYDLEDLRKMLNFDTFLDANQSVSLGLADEIG
jgi:ATP-dependent protease ClpP protease subunit